MTVNIQDQEVIEDFECQYCGGICDGTRKFRIFIDYVGDDRPDEASPVCPDCIATFFTETPEDVKNMKVERI